jgi:hypothetical protein
MDTTVSSSSHYMTSHMTSSQIVHPPINETLTTVSQDSKWILVMGSFLDIPCSSTRLCMAYVLVEPVSMSVSRVPFVRWILFLAKRTPISGCMTAMTIGSMCVYVDNIACVSRNPKAFFDSFVSDHHYTLKGVGPPTYFLGGDFTRDSKDNTLARKHMWNVLFRTTRPPSVRSPSCTRLLSRTVTTQKLTLRNSLISVRLSCTSPSSVPSNGPSPLSTSSISWLLKTARGDQDSSGF